MAPELPQDIFYIVLIDQEITLHDMVGGMAFLLGADDILLVPEGGLRIRDEEGRDERMGMAAFPAQDTLHNEA